MSIVIMSLQRSGHHDNTNTVKYQLNGGHQHKQLRFYHRFITLSTNSLQQFLTVFFILLLNQFTSASTTNGKSIQFRFYPKIHYFYASKILFIHFILKMFYCVTQSL